MVLQQRGGWLVVDLVAVLFPPAAASVVVVVVIAVGGGVVVVFRSTQSSRSWSSAMDKILSTISCIRDGVGGLACGVSSPCGPVTTAFGFDFFIGSRPT